MQITVRCSDCGKFYATDDKHAGRKLTCKSCGASITVPHPASDSSFSPPTRPAASESITFACEGCGKPFKAPREFAGKKTVCKQCGFKVTIPGDAPPSGERKRPAPTPSREPAPASGSLSAEDIYGLAEAPTPRDSGSPSAAPLLSSADEDSGVMPTRLGSPKSLTEDEKKKIARRAEKSDKSKPYRSNSAMGVSFGTVLAIALFGWRMYRRVERFNRPAPTNDFIEAPAEDVVNPAQLAAMTDREAAELIAKPGSGEAREWLDTAKHPDHAIFELGNERARAMVEGFYQRGAEKVYVVDVDKLGDALVSALILVQIPQDPAVRKRCLEWEGEFSEGDGPSRDVGQKYLFITTD